MKINYLSKAVFLFMIIALGAPLMAAANPGNVHENEARALQLRDRLDEIKDLDKKELSKTERKALRREVREARKELAAISGGVYLSVGAILLIALLLILLL